MELDYAAMGKRIKRFRREQRLSQENLAELIDVSTPHMSNIENGKTKFSLQVLIDLANALNTTPDMLLLDQMKSQDKTRCMVIEEIDRELADCTMAQMTLIEESVRSTKKILKSYEKKMSRKEY
ncbi:MAG: helix-turn-helix domain-containing protein [Lachnospiraceae bacterium]|nr:helix-turn-helix domain-containing protein [Lachnospiraceae bacterium]